MSEWDIEDLPDEPEGGLVDQAALTAIVDKVRDSLRSLGLTLIDEGVAFQYQQGRLVALLPCVVRDSAKEKADSDREARVALNKMLAEQHEAMIEDRAKAIREAIGDPNKLVDALFGDGGGDCSHERRHPSGHCLDCGAGLEDE